VAEVAVAQLSTPNSILDPGAPWAPTPGEFGCRREQYFTMADLIRYAQA
jgi:hypothetical protein